MKYLLCFSGGLSIFYNYPRYAADLTLFLSAVLALPGFDPTRTTVLCGDGSTALQAGAVSLPTLVADKAGLLTALQQTAAQLKSEDIFFFFATNHGGLGDPIAKTSTLWCWNEEQLSSDDFAAALKPLNATTQIYLLGQCYSGGFVASLATPGQAVISACQYNEVSYACADGAHDEFLYQFSTALANSSVQTLRQAYNAASFADEQPEHPQLSDQTGILDRLDILGPSAPEPAPVF